MSEYNFLAVPLKSTSDVDLVRPLTTYIESVYNTSDDNKAEVAEAVQASFSSSISKACCQPLDKHQSALDVVTRYYDQLVAIENKIIISATQNPVVFKWKDAFDKGSLFFSKASLSLPDGSFERAAVLFNCGALMSHIAASQPLLTDEEMKTTAKLFQQSAGVFARLRDTVLGMVQHDPTPDLMPDTLAALSTLMLAQAQEAVYIKAYKEKMKPTALVKIAAQAAEFYHDAQKAMNRDVVKGLWDKAGYSTMIEWVQIVSGKTLGFQAIAQFHQAEVNEEERSMGEELSRLGEALRLSETAAKYLPAGCLSEQLTSIAKMYAAAKKDNDFIYHERIVDFRSLPALPRAALVKALPVVYPLSPRFKDFVTERNVKKVDMFSSVVPVQIHNAMQCYESRKGELVNIETGRLREHTQLMNGILASLNLPAALDDVNSMDTLPESIRQKSAKVKQAGGITELQRLFSELPTLYRRNEDILEETNRILTEEKENDDTLRRQFGTKWSRMSSEQLTGPLLQEIGKYRGILHTASNADKMVRNKFEANRVAIDMLSKNEVELRSAIPGQAQHALEGTSEAVSKLRGLMNQVQEIKVQRDKLEKDFKAVRSDIADDLLRALAESDILNEEQISKEKIQQIFGPLKEQVEASIKLQDHVMAEIQTWNNRFIGEKSGSSSGAERERMLKMLAAGHDAFHELKGNLDEGTKASFFYNDLTPILVRLQQKISDFAFARQTEKEDLMRQMQQNIISGGSGDRPSVVPPPRPPPPSARSDVEPPIPPPRTQQSLHATPGATDPNSPSIYQISPAPQLGSTAHPGYYQHPLPYGQPQPFLYQPHYQPNFATPYPTYPGAFPNYQQPYGQFPPPPQQQNPFAPSAPKS
ncbi:BRO1-like domain protein [Dictyocaulus viviparus]|uniref:BRO1-like domain protein n=1 Tax=Dictyocaulus viviparus TaxID=29172 RepID=A0A0D8Y7R7_DICVI|nr:BRO1-like domain protein [Dictyocaulus viviparus]